MQGTLNPGDFTQVMWKVSPIKLCSPDVFSLTLKATTLSTLYYKQIIMTLLDGNIMLVKIQSKLTETTHSLIINHKEQLGSMHLSLFCISNIFFKVCVHPQTELSYVSI